jgi:hypothetical protein
MSKHVEHAIGSLARPLSDEQLETKFHRQASLVIGDVQSRELMQIAWSLPDLPDAGEVAQRSVPQSSGAHRSGQAAAR